MLGMHMLKSYSSTQRIIALPSGGAEHYAVVQGASQGTGVRSMLKYCKMTKASQSPVEVKEFSAAARGIASRRNLVKMEHVD